MKSIIIKMTLIFIISLSLNMMIIYLNYIEVGYNFFEYVYFIKWYILLFLASIYILLKL